MKRFFVFSFLAIAFAVVAGMAVANWWRINSYAPSSNPETQRFIISKGDSASQVGNKLLKQGLIKNSLAFKFYVQLTGAQGKIQAGEYDLSPSLPLVELVDKLTRGPDEFWVTIPEGLRREEVAERIIESLNMNLLEAAVFREEFLKESERGEGFLFPDTYLFARDSTALLVVRKLRQTFEEKTEPFANDVAASDHTLGQLITLASIIERETKTEEERPIVAGILLKRIEADWSLQADATVQYAVGSGKCETPLRQGYGGARCNWWPVLTKDDFEIDSPYNSYKFTGFPPSPIASPGLSSITAAISPQESPYWYYLHDPEGNIYYATTLKEHSENVRKYIE